jgi:hypothetical protein
MASDEPGPGQQYAIQAREQLRHLRRSESWLRDYSFVIPLPFLIFKLG